MTYDEQIELLTNNPGMINLDWCQCRGLFKPVGRMMDGAGCLTMIRGCDTFAIIKGKVDTALTAEIKADERLPNTCAGITIESLPVFKEWQERIDLLQTT